MTATQSNLSNPRYGYDFVLATTQQSINATMKKYLYGLEQKDTYIMLIEDPKTEQTVQTDYDTFVKGAGIDPFNIPANADPRGEQVQKLQNASFVAGIKITLGLPRNWADPTKLPSIIDLKDGVTSIDYNMLCADIRICQLSYSARGAKWKSMAQNDVPDRAWIFKSKVNLKLDSEDFKKLPEEVKQQIKNLEGSMFSIQQLLLDLSSASLMSIPVIDGLEKDSDANALLTKYFVNTYFDLMKTQGKPVLNYVVIHKPQNSTLKPTDLNFHVSPLKGQVDPGCMTLSYLCATEGNQLPPPVNFTWDWISASEKEQYNGIISINRNTFTRYLLKEIYPSAKKDCFIPRTRCWFEGLFTWHNAWSEGQPSDDKITQKLPATGDTLIEISYSAESWDQAGINGALGKIVLKQDYNKTVKVTGNKVIVTSKMVIYLSVRTNLTTSAGNITDKTITDTYELAVDKDGQMTMNLDSKCTENASVKKADAFSDFFVDVNSSFNLVAGREFKSTPFQSTPIAAFQNFVFPGGHTFTFKSFRFSDYQDLLAAITYVDPN